MCGIIAYMGPKNATVVALEGLKRLEYRGYDSWGIAWSDNGTIHLERKTGRIGEAKALPDAPSHLAIAHTRWATHGGVEEKNAHPHLSNDRKLAVVHNGIIENFSELKVTLQKDSYTFSSDTDSEVVPNLLQRNLADTSYFQAAFSTAISRLEGTYALVVLNNLDHSLAFARKGSPLCIGIGKQEASQIKEIFVASDVSAFISHTKDVIYLDENEYGFIEREGSSFSLSIFKTGSAEKITRKTVRLDWDPEMAEKDGYPHFMLKEIMDQPRTIADTMAGRLLGSRVVLDELDIPKAYLAGLKKAVIISCGTAYHAAIISKYQLESLAGLDVETDYASEFRYRYNCIDRKALHIFISQSGETADTLAAMRRAKSAGAKTLSIVNVMGSTLARESDHVLYTRAGPEIGVASTKAFTSQLVTLVILALHIGLENKRLDKARSKKLVTELLKLGRDAESIIKANLPEIKTCAKLWSGSKSALYIGRNINYPIALEGALKLKEISYIHAEGFPAGELKHGPIALIDPAVPSICLAVDSETYPKVLSNIQEIKARKGNVIAVATEGNTEIKKLIDQVFYVSRTDELLSPILSVLPLQLLAYYTALERGCDIDKPRNLAKSVTVE